MRTATAALAAMLAGLAAQAAAQEPASAEVAQLAACADRHLPDLAAAEAACVGLLSRPCTERPEGGTTLGMVDCMQAESAAWDVLLNRAWPVLRGEAKASDAHYAETWQGQPPPSWADALLTAQRAWLAFRDAECAERHASWGSGSMRSIAAADCRLSMTAARTLEFRARAEAQP